MIGSIFHRLPCGGEGKGSRVKLINYNQGIGLVNPNKGMGLIKLNQGMGKIKLSQDIQ